MKICFTTTQEHSYSETFIRRIKELLPGEIVSCYGGFVPRRSDNGRLKNHGSPSLKDVLLKRAGFIREPFAQHYMKEFLRGEKFDLVFANFGVAGGALASVCQEVGVPLIVHFHGADASVRKYYQDPCYNYKGMFEIADAIVVVSRAMREHLLSLGADPRKLHLITYSPDDRFLDVRPAFRSKVCLAAGRFVEKKAPYLTLLAFRKAQQTVPDLQLRMIGDGELLPVCKHIASSLKISNVEFVGVQTPDQIRAHQSEALMFVQHSIQADDGDQEGTPLAVLEASAAGLPVVATRHAGIPDVVKHETTGFLVDEGDVDGMADYMTRIALNTDLARSMGEAGREVIRNDFSGERYRESLVNLVSDIAKRRSG